MYSRFTFSVNVRGFYVANVCVETSVVVRDFIVQPRAQIDSVTPDIIIQARVLTDSRLPPHPTEEP